MWPQKHHIGIVPTIMNVLAFKPSHEIDLIDIMEDVPNLNWKSIGIVFIVPMGELIM